MFGHDNQAQQGQTDGAQADAAANDSAPSLPPVPGSQVTSAHPFSSASSPAPAGGAAAPADAGDLLSIKQEALQQLSPLVDHLDQSPEEKFRTTMMMIQAADNQALIKVAYEAAKQIGDEKVRAQALLDIVNEINYFTQQHKD